MDVYINHVSESLTSEASLTLERLPIPRQPIPGESKDSRRSAPFICPPQPVPQPAALIEPPQGSPSLDDCPPALIPPGLGTRQLGAAPVLQRLLRSFISANPKTACPASPVSSFRNYNKGPCPHFPLTPSASWRPPEALTWHDMPLPLGNCNKLSFLQWFSPDLLASPDSWPWKT